MNKKIYLLFFVFYFQAFAQSEIPAIPLTDNLIQYLNSEGVIEVTSNGFYVEKGTQPKALAKGSGCCWVLRFFKNNVIDNVSGATGFVLDGANVFVSATTDGVKWTVDLTTDGVTYVVEKTLDGTRWTLNSAIDGTQLIIRQATNGLSWTVESRLPDEVRIGGKKYIDFDPVKKVAKAGIRFPAKAANSSLESAQSSLNYLNNLTKDLAVGTLDIVDGVTFISMDVVTFTVSSATNISVQLASLNFPGVLNEVGNTLYYAISNTLGWGDLGWCGSKINDLFMMITRKWVISDYWPPDELVTNLIVPAGQQCRLFGLARLYKGCAIHDYCYGVPMKTKAGCDEEIRQDWLDACADTYRSGSWCKAMCETNVQFFHSQLASGPEAPFTQAQEKSNSNVNFKSEQIAKYDYYKNKYRNEKSNDYLFNKPITTGFVPRPYVVPFIAKPNPSTLIPIYMLLQN